MKPKCEWMEMPVDKDYNDMRLRVINNAPCEYEFVERKLGCWPYGKLFIVRPADGFGDTVTVFFGDLTVELPARQVLELVRLARSREL